MERLESPAQVGEGLSYCIPRAIAERLGLREGITITMRVEERKLLSQPTEDAVELALKGNKFASLSPDEVEKISLEAQKSYENPS